MALSAIFNLVTKEPVKLVMSVLLAFKLIRFDKLVVSILEPTLEKL